jgi:hypothetical protein
LSKLKGKSQKLKRDAGLKGAKTKGSLSKLKGKSQKPKRDAGLKGTRKKGTKTKESQDRGQKIKVK